MASRKSNRLLLSGWTEKASKNKKSTLETAIVIDENTNPMDFKEQTVRHAKKSKKPESEEGKSDRKGKRKAEIEGDDQKKKKKRRKEKKEKKEKKTKKDKRDKTRKEEKGKAIIVDSTEQISAGKLGKHSEIPDIWFKDHTAQKQWKEGYASKQIAFCHLVCTSMIKSMKLNCIRMLKKSSVWKIINPDAQAYPRLTRLFYLNLQQVDSERMILKSRVAGIDIILDHSVFAKVLGCPENYKTDNHPDKKEAISIAKSEFFLPNCTPSSSYRQLTHSVFNEEAKILFTILMRSVVPKENSRELLSEKMLFVMHLVMHGYEVDLPELVMEHMLYSSTKTRNHILPYANLLPKFFQHFGIPVENEEKYRIGIGMINETTMHRLGIVQTVDNGWKFLGTISSTEVKNQKFAKTKALTLSATGSSSQQNSSQVLERLEYMEHDIDELKQGQLELSSEIKRMSYMMKSLNKQVTKYFKTLNILETSSDEDVPAPTEVPQPSESPKDSLGENLNLNLNEEAVPQTNEEDSFDTDTPLVERLILRRNRGQVHSADIFEDAGAMADAQDAGEEVNQGLNEEEIAVVGDAMDGNAVVDEAVLAQEELAEEIEEESEENQDNEEEEMEAAGTEEETEEDAVDGDDKEEDSDEEDCDED